MNCNQNNYNNNQQRRDFWICRPCNNNFPPEMNWDCEDDYKKPCFDEYYDNRNCYNNSNNNCWNERPQGNNRPNNKNNCKHNETPQKDKKCFCGFFKIFHC